MSDKSKTANIRAVGGGLEPLSITIWNRLEGRPRTANFGRALKAEQRDALWSLNRQWALGEFRGSDAGSPIRAKVQVATSPLTEYGPGAPGGGLAEFDAQVPLEAKMECRPIPLELGGQPIGLDLRLALGRHWLKMLAKEVGDYAETYAETFKRRYAFKAPDPGLKEDAAICAHPEVWQSFAAVAGRCMDGGALYLHLTASASNHAYDGITEVADHHKDDIDRLAETFIAWFNNLFHQPDKTRGDAWNAQRLEYQFWCATSADTNADKKVLSAAEFYHGRLDWYNFDIDPQEESLGEIEPRQSSTAAGKKYTQSVIPTALAFEGMPNSRWWTFEDRKTNFGDVRPDTTDIAKLLLIEFGLVYANDWFLLPFALPVGGIARTEGIVVTNVFGERYWIEAAGEGPDDAWQRWSMFGLGRVGTTQAPADMGLLLLPTVPKTHEGGPMEEVMLSRDEMQNNVWGVERIVPLANGTTRSGREAALETLRFHRGMVAKQSAAGASQTTIEPAASIRYRAMNSVPENWIPFIPVRVDGDIREIQLQRGAMLRIIEGQTEVPDKVRPRTVLLREGLDAGDSYFIHEEEIPRSGIVLRQWFRRTRWSDGNVFVWLGVQKRTGKGEGSSGLAFDQIVNTRPKKI